MPLSKKEQKRLYDIEYRKKNKERIKLLKQKYYASKEGKEQQKRARQKRLQNGYHTAYCAKPEQKEKTKKRDALRRHGEFRECFEILWEIHKIVMDYYEKNNNGLGSKYARLKARGYVFKKAIKRRI